MIKKGDLYKHRKYVIIVKLVSVPTNHIIKVEQISNKNKILKYIQFNFFYFQNNFTPLTSLEKELL